MVYADSIFTRLRKMAPVIEINAVYMLLYVPCSVELDVFDDLSIGGICTLSCKVEVEKDVSKGT